MCCFYGMCFKNQIIFMMVWIVMRSFMQPDSAGPSQMNSDTAIAAPGGASPSSAGEGWGSWAVSTLTKKVNSLRSRLLFGELVGNLFLHFWAVQIAGSM